MNLSGFDDVNMRLIQQTISIFKHFTFAPDAENWKWLRINGGAFGNTNLDYCVLPFTSRDFHVQVGPAGFTMAYKFGVVFSPGKDPLQYHHPMD